MYKWKFQCFFQSRSKWSFFLGFVLFWGLFCPQWSKPLRCNIIPSLEKTTFFVMLSSAFWEEKLLQQMGLNCCIRWMCWHPSADRGRLISLHSSRASKKMWLLRCTMACVTTEKRWNPELPHVHLALSDSEVSELLGKLWV